MKIQIEAGETGEVAFMLLILRRPSRESGFSGAGRLKKGWAW